MTLKQIVGISDASGRNQLIIDSSGRMSVNIGASSVNAEISGDVVYLVSGRNEVAVVGSITTSISGNQVFVSGQPVAISGAFVNISGATVNNIDIASSTSVFRTASGVKCTSLSGGVAFPSLAGDRITIRASNDNSGRIYLGSTINPPFSGHGLQFGAGQSETFAVTNANIFHAFASASGDTVTFATIDVV